MLLLNTNEVRTIVRCFVKGKDLIHSNSKCKVKLIKKWAITNEALVESCRRCEKRCQSIRYNLCKSEKLKMSSKNLISTVCSDFEVNIMQFLANFILSLEISFFVAVSGAYSEGNILNVNQITIAFRKLLNLTWMSAWNNIVLIFQNSFKHVLFELELIIIESEHELLKRVSCFLIVTCTIQ